MMRRMVLFSLCLFLLQASCRKSSFDNNNRVLLNHCLDKRFGSNQVSLCFDSVLQDSRCPMYMDCIWAGYVLAEFTFHEGGNTNPLRLSSKPGLPGPDTTISGYHIRLITVNPYPGSVPAPVSADVSITR